MASIIRDPNGRWRISFISPDASRKTIRLGKCHRKGAEGILRHVEALIAAKIGGQPAPRETAVWLANVGVELRKRLAATGLIEAPKSAVLGQFLEAYILSRPDVKPATLEVWQQPCRNLKEFFGEEKLLRVITAGDAEQFKHWILTQGLAPATIAKRLAFARTFFHTARKHKIIDENPFVELRIPPANASSRQAFVDRQTMHKVLGKADLTWRTIIALSRFGGLRCPSEVLSLEWRHVDWEKERINVPSPKTDRYVGKGSRTIPLFAELRPFLSEAYKFTEEGQTHVVGGDHLARAQGPNGWRNCNLRTTFAKLIRRAGLDSWPRLFHNLRASRETELLESFPVHVVAQWMGHDPKVCLKHYAQTTNDHFERATRGDSVSAEVGRVRSSSITGCGVGIRSPESLVKSQLKQSQETRSRSKLEESGECLTAPAPRDCGEAELRGPVDPGLALVVGRWPQLCAAIRACIVSIAQIPCGEGTSEGSSHN